MLAYIRLLLLWTISMPFTTSFRMNFGHQQQQQQQQRQHSYEDSVLNNPCKGYLCPDTLACVSKPQQCPCPFPKSQLKCIVSTKDNSKKNYYCISKPATNDLKLAELYDDPVKGPLINTPGIRDCGWIQEILSS